MVKPTNSSRKQPLTKADVLHLFAIDKHNYLEGDVALHAGHSPVQRFAGPRL